MKITRKQKNLLDAVEEEDLQKVRRLLKNCEPDFVNEDEDNSPMWAAITAGNLDIVRAIVNAGGDVDFPVENETPLAYAVRWNEDKIAQYLRSQGASKSLRNWKRKKKEEKEITENNESGDAPVIPPPEKKIVFTAENLKDHFNAKSWTGKLDEMEKLWEEVPERLKKKFDFATVVAEVQRDTLKQKYTKRPPLKNGH